MKSSPDIFLMCRQLEKRFGKKVVFKDFNFAFAAGCVALTGKNGAGKSTLISMLCGITTPDHGSITIADHDLKKHPIQAKGNLAFVPDEPIAYDFMSGFEYLMMICTLKRIAPTSCDMSLLQKFEIDGALHQRFKDMSLGTQRKFMIVGGLMCNPLVLIMDEPTNGLDFKAKATLASIINGMRAEKLVFFSTHDQSFIDDTQAQVLALVDIGEAE